MGVPGAFCLVENYFSEPAGVRVHPNFVNHLQSSSEVCCLEKLDKVCAAERHQQVLSGKLHNL